MPRGHDGWTPLHWACQRGHVQVFQALLEHGAEIEATDYGGSTPLYCACSNGRLAVVIEFLSPSDSNGETTILGERNSRGANIEAKDNTGDTPLHVASRGGYLAVVKALLSGGADILAANNSGMLPIDYVMLPIDYAMSDEESEVLKCLLQHFYATTRRLPLHKLLEDLTWIGNLSSSDVPTLRDAFNKNFLGTDDVVEILEYLVGRNHELLSYRDQDGLLPLHVACRRGVSFPIVQSLVKQSL
jgi:ankyrin repeat protein